MNKKLLSMVFVILLVSSSMGVAQINPPVPRTNELGENVFGEQETGESILVEAYEYEPKQVRSGVLEEQPVPVYVFLKATTLGGLIAGQEGPEAAPFYGLPEIKLVSNPVVVGGDRRFVGGVTFVPSNRGRRTLVDDTGRFIDLGYFIVRLNKIDKESDLPGFRSGSFDVDVANVSDAAKTSFLQTGGGRIDLNVSLDVRFAFENSLGGFGANDLLLGEEANEAEWKKQVTIADSFWNGKGYVRANRIDEKNVNLVVYDGNLRQIGSVTLTEGQESRAIALYMYPFTLVDRFRIQLQKIDVAADKARFLVNDNIVMRGKGERIIAGSDWIVDKITRTKQLDGGISVEEVALRNTKTGDLKPFQRKYQGDKTGLRQGESNGGRATTTTTVPAVPAAPRAQAGDVTGEYADLINKYARLNKLEPAFVRAMINIESGFNFKTVSRKKDGSLCGAVGLMQLISETAAQYGKFTKERFFEEGLDGGCNAGRAGRLLNGIKSVSDDELKKGLIDIRFNPEENIKSGSAYLGYLYGFYKSKTSQDDEVVKLTVAAYNAGEGAINRRCQTNGYRYAACEPFLEEETKGHVVKFIPVYHKYKLEAAGGVAAPPAPPSVAVAEAPKVEATAIENDCKNFKDFANEKLDEKKSADELHCKAIKELEKTLTLTDDENIRGEAYYWIGENYFALGNYQLALGAYEKVTGLYQIRAQSRMVDATERLKGKVLEETKAYLDEEGLQVAFLGIRELQSQEGPAVYIRVNKGEAKKFGLDSVLPTGNLNDGKPYQLKIDAIDRAQVVLRKVYEDKSLGSQIVVKEGGQRAINEGVQVTLDVVDIESKDVALITILPGSGRAVSRSYVQLHIPIEQRAIQFSGKQIDWQINKTQALIQKMDVAIARMNTWLQRWKLACFGVYGLLTMKNFLKGGDDVKARDIVYRGMENGKGIDDLICNEQNIGYNKQYQSADECRLKNRKVLEGFVDATKGSLGEIEGFNKELNLLTRDGKKLSQLDDATLKQQVYNKIVADEKQLSYQQFKTLIENNATTKEEILQTYKSKELGAAYAGKRNDLLLSGVPEPQVDKVLEQQGQVYSIQLGKLRNSASDFDELKKKEKENPKVSPDVIRLMVADDKEKAKTKVSGEDYRVYKIVVDGKDTYYGYEGGKPIELEQKIDDQNVLVQNTFTIVGKEKKPENERKVTGGMYEFGKIQEKFSRDKTIRVDQNGRVTRMPWEKGKYIEVLEWYQNGDPKTVRVVAYRDVGGATEEAILYHQSAIDANPVLKSELERVLRKKPFCKPGEKAYAVEGVVFTCDLQLPIEQARGVECQDVMPAADCAVLFNVCDPVICPASRFDLGGRWKLPPGRSVVDTGVIGALTLGMPNFVGFGGENVIPPVCGPGVLAGLESWRSMLQAYNQCMIASKTSGKTVGICDAIRSVYVCEIVWREGKSFGGLLGGVFLPEKARGGGEYTDFQRSLTAIGDSAEFFTQEYGRSSFAAFKSRSLDEAGTEFCKAAYFGKAPGLGELLNKLAQPESPPQFTAWFDAFEWTGEAGRTALNPGLSLSTPAEQNRYAVYYHIYAGRDREVRYSVWLQDRSGSVRVPVTNALGGYTREVIQKGGYADKQVEIIAGKGLEQVCVEINAAIFCGFGKVATGFLQNYVNDVLVQRELGKEITNEKDCVGDDSLGPAVGGVALPTQAGIGTSAVRRICSLKDPDEGSNQDRWKVVGSCGKGKNAAGQVVDYGSCWIDAASLNLQFRNLDDAAKQRFGELGKLYPDAFAAEEKLKRERFEPLFKKLEGLFTDIVKVNGGISLRKKQEVVGKYAAAMDGVSSLIATSLFRDADYQYLVENSVQLAGNSSLRIGQLYMALADLKKVVEEKEVEEKKKKDEEIKKQGGGSGGGGEKGVSELTVEGTPLTQKRGDVYTFSLFGDTHALTILNIVDGVVAYRLGSKPVDFTLKPGQYAQVDADGDGSKEFFIELKEIKKEGEKLVAVTFIKAVQGSCRKARATDAIECVLKMGSEDSLLGLRVKLLGITELDEGSSLIPEKLKQYVDGGGKQVNFALSLTKDGQPVVCKKLFGLVQQPDISVIFSPGELFVSPLGGLFPTTVNGYFYYKNKRVTEHKTTQCTDLNVGAENVILHREELLSVEVIDYFPKESGGILKFNLVYPGLDKILSDKNMRIEIFDSEKTTTSSEVIAGQETVKENLFLDSLSISPEITPVNFLDKIEIPAEVSSDNVLKVRVLTTRDVTTFYPYQPRFTFDRTHISGDTTTFRKWDSSSLSTPVHLRSKVYEYSLKLPRNHFDQPADITRVDLELFNYYIKFDLISQEGESVAHAETQILPRFSDLKTAALGIDGLNPAQKTRIELARTKKEFARELYFLVQSFEMNSQAAQDLSRYSYLADKDYAPNSFYIGQSLFVLGRYSRAISYFENAVRVNPNNKQYQDYLAEANKLLEGIVPEQIESAGSSKESQESAIKELQQLKDVANKCEFKYESDDPVASEFPIYYTFQNGVWKYKTGDVLDFWIFYEQKDYKKVDATDVQNVKGFYQKLMTSLLSSKFDKGAQNLIEQLCSSAVEKDKLILIKDGKTAKEITPSECRARPALKQELTQDILSSCNWNLGDSSEGKGVLGSSQEDKSVKAPLVLDALKKEATQVLGLSERDKQRIYSAKDTKELAQIIHDVVWGGTIDSDRTTAIALLKIAEMADSDNAQVQFRIGYYYSLEQKYGEALPFFEKAVRLNQNENTYREHLKITRDKVDSGLGTISVGRSLSQLKEEAKKTPGLSQEDKKKIDDVKSREEFANQLLSISVWADINAVDSGSLFALRKIAVEADSQNSAVQRHLWEDYVLYYHDYPQALPHLRNTLRLDQNSFEENFVIYSLSWSDRLPYYQAFFEYAIQKDPVNRQLYQKYLDKVKAKITSSGETSVSLSQLKEEAKKIDNVAASSVQTPVEKGSLPPSKSVEQMSSSSLDALKSQAIQIFGLNSFQVKRINTVMSKEELAEVLHNIGVIPELNRELRKKTLQLAILANPTTHSSYFQLGYQYYLDRDYDKALTYFKKAQELNPGNPLYSSFVKETTSKLT